MAEHGLVSFAADPTTETAITDDWTAHHKKFGATRVRVPIVTTTNGLLPTDLYKTALARYYKAGIQPIMVFAGSFLPTNYQHLFPNMALNNVGNRSTSLFIDQWTLRAEGFLKQLADLATPKMPLRAIVWNEPNVLLVPPNKPIVGPKASAMHPAAFAGLCLQAAERWKAAGVKDVYCGSLSVLPFTGTDPANPYYAVFLTTFYQTLKDLGYTAPWPWTGWSVNIEGFWNPDRLSKALGVLREIMLKNGDTGQVIVGEWGWQNGSGVSAQAATTTYHGIQQTVKESYFFQGPGLVPYLGDPSRYTDYGAFSWRQEGSIFVPGADYDWGPVLRGLFK